MIDKPVAHLHLGILEPERDVPDDGGKHEWFGGKDRTRYPFARSLQQNEH
jgi:hypothetical protein